MRTINELDGIDAILWDEEENKRLERRNNCQWPECEEYCLIVLKEGETCEERCSLKFV